MKKRSISAVNLFNKSSISVVNLFNKHAYQQSTYQQVTEGAGGRGEALIFAAPPKGEQGVMGPLMKILQILKLRGTPPLPPAPARNLMFFWTYFRGSFLHPNEPK